MTSYRLRPSWLGYVFLGFYVAVGLICTAFEAMCVSALLGRHGEDALPRRLLLGPEAIFWWLLGAFFWSYMGNALGFRIEINGSRIRQREVFRASTLDIAQISRIAFLTGGRGWRYIGLFGPERVMVITNSLYSEKSFDELTAKITEWAASYGKAGLCSAGDNAPGKLGKPSFRYRDFAVYLVVTAALALAGALLLWRLGFHPLVTFRS